MEAKEQEVNIKNKFKFRFIYLVIIIAIAGYVGTYYYYNKYKETKIVLDNPQVASQNEVNDIKEKLGKIYELPTDEEPSVATVLDVEKIKDQPFFAKAKNGDKVVIYSKAQVAILYRTSENKIINVAPVSLDQPEEPVQPVETSSPKLKATEEPTE